MWIVNCECVIVQVLLVLASLRWLGPVRCPSAATRELLLSPVTLPSQWDGNRTSPASPPTPPPTHQSKCRPADEKRGKQSRDLGGWMVWWKDATIESDKWRGRRGEKKNQKKKTEGRARFSHERPSRRPDTWCGFRSHAGGVTSHEGRFLTILCSLPHPSTSSPQQWLVFYNQRMQIRILQPPINHIQPTTTPGKSRHVSASNVARSISSQKAKMYVSSPKKAYGTNRERSIFICT